MWCLRLKSPFTQLLVQICSKPTNGAWSHWICQGSERGSSRIWGGRAKGREASRQPSEGSCHGVFTEDLAMIWLCKSRTVLMDVCQDRKKCFLLGAAVTSLQIDRARVASGWHERDDPASGLWKGALADKLWFLPRKQGNTQESICKQVIEKTRVKDERHVKEAWRTSRKPVKQND